MKFTSVSPVRIVKIQGYNPGLKKIEVNAGSIILPNFIIGKLRFSVAELKQLEWNKEKYDLSGKCGEICEKPIKRY